MWRGMIAVDEAGQRTDAYQRNDNLMLAKTARADSIPGLEIEADDVRCTHGSTSGRVDDTMIYYAMSARLHAARGGPHDRHRLLPAGVRPYHDRLVSARRSAKRSAPASKTCRTSKLHQVDSEQCDLLYRCNPGSVGLLVLMRGRWATVRSAMRLAILFL